MNELDALIEEKTGLTIEQAMRIDKVNLYKKLGEETFWKLSKTFYTKVFTDEEVWFRNIFKNRSIEEAIENQAQFFMQRMGGPAYFTQRKGHPALMGRHMNFNMAEKAANRWLLHMKASIAETTEIDEDSAGRMMDYFTHTAFFLSIGVSKQQPVRREEE